MAATRIPVLIVAESNCDWAQGLIAQLGEQGLSYKRQENIDKALRYLEINHPEVVVIHKHIPYQQIGLVFHNWESFAKKVFEAYHTTRIIVVSGEFPGGETEIRKSGVVAAYACSNDVPWILTEARKGPLNQNEISTLGREMATSRGGSERTTFRNPKEGD